MSRVTTPAGTFRVPLSKALLEELRAEIADLNARLHAVDYGRDAAIEHGPAYIVGWAQGSTDRLLDVIEGRIESEAARDAWHRKIAPKKYGGGRKAAIRRLTEGR